MEKGETRTKAELEAELDAKLKVFVHLVRNRDIDAMCMRGSTFKGGMGNFYEGKKYSRGTTASMLLMVLQIRFKADDIMRHAADMDEPATEEKLLAFTNIFIGKAVNSMCGRGVNFIYNLRCEGSDEKYNPAIRDSMLNMVEEIRRKANDIMCLADKIVTKSYEENDVVRLARYARRKEKRQRKGI